MDESWVWVLRVHWVSGGVALVAAPIALAMRKGGRWHRAWGRIFIACMIVVCITALAASIPKGNYIMALVGLFSAHLVLSGWRSLYLKRLHKGQRPDRIDMALQGSAAVFNAGLLLWGMAGLLLKHDHNPMYGVFAVFGLIGCMMVFRFMWRFYRLRHERHTWLYDHVVGMVAGYIATVSAFSAVNVAPLFPAALTAAAWIWPTLVGTPAIWLTVRYYQRRYARSRTPHDDFKVKLG